MTRAPTSYERVGTNLEFDRVAFFSDAVYAIAMTLLVVGIGVPDNLDEGLREKRAEIISFFISFVVLGNYWLAHHRFVAELKRIDTRFMKMNLVYLAAIAFIPFPTALVGAFEEATIAVVMYAVALGAASFMEAAMFLYAARTDALRRRLSPVAVRFGLIASLLPVLVFAISIPIAFWNTSAALLSWLLVFPAEIVASRYFAPPETDDLFG